ncbi:HTH-type transcriptional regulator BenM (plasmid) [Sulfitobacter indolifex]|uniref:LysR substrate-binding domain-containing protein n=2 Tax=Sulfitobacter indolifex TaxID=225422 RepID=UPI001FAD35C3|nr:LysR substrate-binding domain-containing protein [Sulfitobacter indolifex]UOA20552.1 HTH-type transcriptional regulator BenM [Sulfitobacter indolifex]UOA20879.1 HTH-type transcriptional regulator BenM [Sulfitobacter indolifex]
MNRSLTATLRQYEAFDVVAETLHFGRAAQLLGVAQPALTQQIKQLEAEFGGELLFDRNRRRVLLTEFGETVLPEVRALLRQAHRVENIADAARGGRRGRIELAYIGSASYAGVLGRVLKTFRAGTDVDLVLHELDMDLQIREIVAGRIDAGFVRLPLSGVPDVLVTRDILEEDIMLALPRGHRLEGAESVRMADLCKESFIFTHLGPDLGFAACAYALCSDAGFTPHIAHRARQFTAIVSFVSAGLGVAFVPASVARMAEVGVSFVRISDATVTSRIGLAHLDAPTNPTLRRLLAILEPIDRL